MDWYQNVKNVIINVYAKKVSKQDSKINFEKKRLIISVHFGDQVFEKTVHLPDEIDPSQSTIEVLSTKVEIVLRKAVEGEQWDVNWII